MKYNSAKTLAMKLPAMKAGIEDLAVEQKEKEIIDKVKKERLSSYTCKFKVKVLKDLNNGQLAVCDIADKLRIQKSLLAKQIKEENVSKAMLLVEQKRDF